jgi:hypothetical protein
MELGAGPWKLCVFHHSAPIKHLEVKAPTFCMAIRPIAKPEEGEGHFRLTMKKLLKYNLRNTNACAIKSVLCLANLINLKDKTCEEPA